MDIFLTCVFVFVLVLWSCNEVSPTSVQNVSLSHDSVSKTVAIGDILHITCTSIPASSIWWFIGDNNVTENSESTIISNRFGIVTESTLILMVQLKYHNMKVACIAQNLISDTPISDTTILNVLYPPTVKVYIPTGTEHQDSLTMRCRASGGNPGIFNYTGWQHFYNGHYIRKFGGIGITTSLTLRDLTYEDTGNYKCYVRTDIKRQDGTTITVKGLDTLKIEAEPKFFIRNLEFQAMVGSNLTIDVPFLLFSNAKPKSTDVVWRNLSDGSILQNSLRVTQEIHMKSVNVSMHSRYLMWNGYSAHLEFVNIQPCDFVSYNVLVKNTKGDTNITITLTEGCDGGLFSICGGLVYFIIGIGGVFVFLMMILIIVCCKVRQRRRKTPKQGRCSKVDGQSVFRGEIDSQGYLSPVPAVGDGYLSPTLNRHDPNSQHLYDLPVTTRRSENMYTSAIR